MSRRRGPRAREAGGAGAHNAADPSSPEIDEFLRKPDNAVVATLRPDGSPHTAVTWYDWEDGRVLLNMEATRMRLAWMARDERVALSAINPENFYEHVSLLGRIVDIHDDVGLIPAAALAHGAP